MRIICKYQGCGTVIEVPLARLLARAAVSCPVCNQPLQKAAPHNHLTNLAAALLKFVDGDLDYVDVEFALPDRGE